MNFLTRLLLENPLQLALLSLLPAVVSYAFWLRTAGPARRWIWPATLALIAALFIVQSAIKTTREQIVEALDALIRAVDREDLGAIEAALTPDYSSEDLDRDGMMRFIEAALKKVDVFDARIHDCDIEVLGSSARMSLSVTATVRREGVPGRVPSRWEIDWLRGQGGWQVSAIKPREVAGMSMTSLKSLGAVAWR